MKPGHIYFEIQADDPKRANDFYSQVFGWRFTEVRDFPSLIGRSKPGAHEVDC